MQSITVQGRRWFRKSAGNTYSSAVVLIDGAIAFQVPKQYGYGDYYLQAAFEELDRRQVLDPPREQHANGSSEPPWRWAERAGIVLHYSATNVARERDL
jgi:hypothetical protein